MEVQGVRITHPDKVLFPQDGITKLDLVQYYAAVAPRLLRYAAGRPLTLRLYPTGIDEPGIYLKRIPKGAPAWLKTFRDLPASALPGGDERPAVDYVVARDEEDVRTFIWTAQYNAVEVHPWLSRIDHPDTPDWAVLDLDLHGAAGQAAGAFARVTHAARRLRQRFADAGLQVFPKLSGQSGIHLLLPLAPLQPFDDVRAYLLGLARGACGADPDLLTTDYDVAERGGRVLIDYAQNARGRHTVAPYSVRPRPGAPVSAPVTWDELDDPELRADRWTLRTLPGRLADVGDVLAPALTLRQRIPDQEPDRETDREPDREPDRDATQDSAEDVE